MKPSSSTIYLKFTWGFGFTVLATIDNSEFIGFFVGFGFGLNIWVDVLSHCNGFGLVIKFGCVVMCHCCCVYIYVFHMPINILNNWYKINNLDKLYYRFIN